MWTQEGNFGALGHGISDVDTGSLMEISDGLLYNAEVISIVKGTQGTARRAGRRDPLQ